VGATAAAAQHEGGRVGVALAGFQNKKKHSLSSKSARHCNEAFKGREPSAAKCGRGGGKSEEQAAEAGAVAGKEKDWVLATNPTDAKEATHMR
jgi:hypothetical protein